LKKQSPLTSETPLLGGRVPSCPTAELSAETSESADPELDWPPSTTCVSNVLTDPSLSEQPPR